MTEIPIANLEKLLEPFDNTKLKDKSLQVDLLEGAVEKPVPVNIPSVTFSVGAFGSLNVMLFNSSDDQDEDGILGQASDDATDAAPLIPFDGTSAWLKYQAEAGIKASGSGTLNDLGFNLEGEQRVTTHSYRIHDPNATVRSAVVSDLASPRFIFLPDHILKLEKGEAVSMHVQGDLNSEVTLRWSDIFSSNLNALNRLIDSNEVIAIQTKAAASIDFDVRVKDDFLVAFARVDAGAYRVTVKKALSHALGGTLGAEIHVAFKNPKAAESVLNQVLEGLLGQAVAKVKKLLAKTKIDDLTEQQKAMLEELAHRLGLDAAAADKLEALKKKWEDLQIHAREAIHTLATQKVQVGFAYEYSRISSKSVLLQAVLSADAVKAHHKNLIRFNLSSLLRQIRKQSPGVTLERYLNEKTLAIRQALGFTLGIDKWTFSGKDVKTIKQITRENFQQQKQISFLGTRSYASAWGRDTVQWAVDFNAQMARFSLQQTPLASEFDYTLLLLWNWEEHKLDEHELAAYVDHAVLWKAVTPGEAPALTTKLFAQLKDQKDIRFSCQLIIDSDAFSALLPKMAEDDSDRFADALGAAMPWWEDYPIRRSVALRRLFYGRLWKAYLNSPNAKPALLAQTAEDFLENHDKKLARREGLYPKNKAGENLLFAGLARLNGDTFEQWASFKKGMKRLNRAVTDRATFEEIRTLFNDLRGFWAQSHHVRTLGAYLLDLAKDRPDLMPGIERTFTVQYTDTNGDDQVINVTSS